MANLTIQQIFGDAATQDESTITISKLDLANSSRFTVVDEADGESIFVAIMVQAYALGLDALHRDGDDGEVDQNLNQQVAINPPITNVVPRQDDEGNVSFYKRDSFIVDLDVPILPINPDDY
ncbi:hypothetical protein [Nostoc sp.]|uniref:hypothetical protein n=1 Tax=Nostoc sp. TaxID=1180 RepID=UPI002FF74F12